MYVCTHGISTYGIKAYLYHHHFLSCHVETSHKAPHLNSQMY